MNNIYNLPSGKPLGTDIKKNVGNALTGPNPQPAPKTAKEAREQAYARLNKFAIQAPKQDVLKYDKPFTFNSDVNGSNFERYYAHPKFKQLGFSPFRDNETVYNQNSSLWDDVTRARKQWLPLAGLAVSGTFGNWDDLLSGKPDVDNAIEMERYMNIGSSSREGFGAKALNFGVNSAYTAGVIGSILAEEAVFAGAALTGVGTGVAAAGTVRNTLRLGKAFDRLADVFRTGSDINQARKTWDTIGKVSRAVLPFQNTADLFRTAERTKMGWDKMDDFAKAYNSFGAFYRDLREINLVTSEAKLEGGFVQNEVANDLIKQFREREGRDPNDAESAKIYQQALKAGFTTSYANMAGIYASNKVVLNKLLKGIPVVGQLEHAASKSVRGSIVKNADWLKSGKNPYEVLYGLKKFGNAQWLTQTAKNAPKSGLRYMTANLMEGTQEVYQEATAEAMKKYYIDTFNDPSRAHQGYMMESIKHGLKSQMSGQGLEVFLSGALMAGPIQVAGLAMTKTGQYANMLNLKRQEKAFSSNPENAGKENPYTKKLNEFKEWDSKVVNALNDVTKNKKDYFSKLYRNTKEQKDLGDLFEDAVLNNDTKTAIDSKDDSLFTHIKTLRKSGTLDLFKEELQSLSQLSDKELAEAFNEKDGANPVDSKTIGERINTVLGRIDEIDNHLSDVEKLTNIYDPKTDFFKWFAFEEARELVAYNDYSYKRTGDRMLSIQEDIKKAMSAVKLDPLYADIAPLFNVGRGGSIIMGATENYGMESEIELLTKEIENLQGTTEPDLVRRRNELTAKKKSLSELSVAVQNVVTANKLLKNTNATQEEQDEAAERVKTAEELLYDAFKKHLQNLSSKGAAGVSSGLFDSTIDTLFAKYKDYWRLSSDQAYLANAINTLYNPEVFGQAVDRLSEAAAEADRVKAEQAKKMAVEFEKRYATNDFLNDLLSKFNVFVSEEEAEAYLANNIVPSKFINADTGYEIDPRANADKFNEILDLIDQYDEIFFERTGERLFKPAFGDIGARVAGTITQTGVEVNELIPEFNPNDKRTLADIAEEFGFDKGRAESSVRIDTILNAIIASTYATPAQKELARKLITLTDKAELINFRQNHHINSSYDKTNGVVVDARYSSKDYGAKASVPIEYSILNALMQKVITDSLQDTEFANRITELRQLASASTNNTTKLLYKYALVSNEQFVAELLTNGDFQEYLATVDYSGDQTELTQEAASIWSKFLDILKDILQKLLGFNTSLYREAMAVTLNKLSQPRTQGPKAQPTPGPQTPAGGAAPTADTQDQELMRKLRDKYDAIISGMSPEEAARMSFDSWRTTDSAAIAIIRKHNADKIRAQAAGGTGAGSTTTVTIAAKRNALTASGRTHGEINAMTEEEFEEAYNNIGKDGFVPNLNNEDWGEVDTNMQIARDRAAALRLGLTEDKKKYIQYDENGNPIPGTERDRMSDVVKDAKVDSNPEATSRGNLIDVLFKDFLMGKLQSSDEFKQRYKELQPQDGYNATNFSDEMLEDLFDIVRTVQRNLVKSGIKVIPDFPKIAAQLGNKLVAGEMDLVGYKKNGEVVIIDIKTSVANRRLGYVVDAALRNALGDKYGELITAMKDNKNVIQKAAAAMKDPADTALVLQTVGEAIKFYPEFEDFQNGTNIVIPLYYPVSDRRQQLGYKEALRQTTGLVADKIYAFPVTVDAFKNGKHERAQLIGPFIAEGTTSNAYAIPIDTSRSIYELGIKDITQTFDAYPTNPLAKKAPQQPAPATPISELDRLNAEVIRLVNIRSNDKVVRQAIIDSNNSRITLEELDAITKKWDDENGLTAAMEAYDAEKKKQSTPVSDIEVPKLSTVRIDLSILSIEELRNVAKQLRQKAIDARQAEKEGKTVLGGSASIESDYQAVKKYIAELAALEGTQLEEEPTPRESAIQAAEELIKTAPTKAKNIRKDIEMMRVSDGFIGSKAPETKDTYVSATEAYQRGWGTAANPSDFTGMTAVMISGSGTWNPKQTGGKINNEDVNRHFELFYKPLINKAIQQGVTTFNIGNAAGMDKVVSDYLESNGFQKTTKGEWNEFKKEKIVNPTRTYDNKPIAKSLKGKVIYITPDSYTTGDMSKHSEDLVIGNELVDEVILGLDQEALKVKLESLSQGTSKLSKAAAGLLYFLKNTGISENTLSGKDNFKYLLAVLERNGNTTISAEIYTKALTEARKLANEGKTVIFDNIGVLKFGTDIDLAILNAESDIAKKADTTTTGKTAIADAENDFQGPKKRVFIGNAETIITGGAVTRIPKALKDLRALINSVNNKVDFATTKDYLTTLQSMGILEELLEDQNITKETFQALLNQKQAQVATQLSISDLVSNEQVLVKFLNKKGEERIGLVVGETTDNMLEIKDITDEYKKLNEGNLFVDVDDLGYPGLGTKAKSLKLAERDVNERVLSIIKSEKVDKPETVTKAQSNTTQSNADAERKAQEDNLMDWDPTDKNARDKNNKDFLSCGDL